MKILMVNKFLHPNGGSETYIFKLGEALVKLGHEVQYFGMEHEGRCVGNRANAYTSDMDFHDAPETYVFYAEEACSAIADAIENSYRRDDSGEKMHMHKEPGMMHCYASAPVFRESRRDFNKQICLLRQL